MIRTFLSIAAAATALVAIGSSANAEELRWTGIVAVKESPMVNQIVADSGSDPGVYGMTFLHMMKAKVAGVEPAPGKYCFIPYDDGSPIDDAYCINTTSGVYTFHGPAKFFQPGTAMCVRVPGNWPAIAGQKLHPVDGGYKVNCRDFGDEAADPTFADRRETAAMIVVIEPADTGQ